jgi:hypothetical protein
VKEMQGDWTRFSEFQNSDHSLSAVNDTPSQPSSSNKVRLNHSTASPATWEPGSVFDLLKLPMQNEAKSKAMLGGSKASMSAW